MYGEFQNEKYTDTGHKMRSVKSLTVQIKNDYAELNQLWQKVDYDKISEIEIDELVKKISWIKKGLKILKEFQIKDIEGVLWLDAGQIEKDLKVKENQIKIIGSVQNEKDYSQKK